jgi:hypothetical protein
MVCVLFKIPFNYRMYTLLKVIYAIVFLNDLSTIL